MRIYILLVSLVMVGCASPAYFKVPMQRFETPQVVGKTFGGAAAVGYSSQVYVTTVDDINSNPPNTNGSVISRDPNDFTFETTIDFLTSVAIDLRIGIEEKFELAVMNGFTSGKFQFLGGSQLNAKEGEWLGALVAGVYSDTGKGSSGDNRYSIDATGTQVSLLFGKQIKPDTLVYTNFSNTRFTARTYVYQTSDSYGFTGEGSQGLWALGLKKNMDSGLFIQLEATYTNTQWVDAKTKEYGSAGLIFGGNFK